MVSRSYLPTIQSQSDISFDRERAQASPSPKSPGSPLSDGSSGRINAGAFWKNRNSQGDSLGSGDKSRLNDAYSYSSQPPSSRRNDPLPAPPPPSSMASTTPTISLGSPRSSFSPPDAPPNSRATTTNNNGNDSGLSLPSSLFVSSPSATAGHSPAFPPSNNFLLGPELSSPNAYSNAPSSSSAISVYTNNGTDTGTLSSSPPTRQGGIDNDEDLMLSLMAGQASVDVGVDGYRIMGWEEVEDSKKELSLLTDRVKSLTSRSQREQKILTAARTLDRLHVNHKRMSKQTMEELAVAEKRAASAEKDMWAVSERESSLRRRLNEHYAASLSWESRRLQRLNVSANRNSRSGPDPKGKERETELSLEIDRLAERVRELEMLIADSGEREASVAAETKAMRKELEKERRQGKEMREEFEAQIAEFRRMAQQDQDQDRSTSSIHESAEQARTILSPLLALGTREPPPEDASVDELALRVREEYENLEAQVRESKLEMKAVREGLEGELARVTKDRDGLQKVGAEEEKKWTEERDRLKSQLFEAKRTRSVDSSTSSHPAEFETTKAQLQSLWSILPSITASSLSPRTPHLGSHRSTDSASSRFIPTPSPSDFNFPALAQPNGVACPYPGLQGFTDRVKALVEDGRLLVERTAKYAKERDIHKSNSERAQRLVQESRAGLERYQSQVRALEERLHASGAGNGQGESLQQFNELENTISVLREDKRRLEISLNAQVEACDALAEANESLSTRALSLAEEAASEKRAMQKRLEAEIERLRVEMTKIRDDMDDQRAREQGQGIVLLDELNSLQDEVQTLRKQLRK